MGSASSSSSSVGMEGLTSGASGRVIPVFRRVILFLHSLFLWFLLILFLPGKKYSTVKQSSASALRKWKASSVSSSSSSSPSEDVNRRRALADGVEMVCVGNDDDDTLLPPPCRCTTSLFFGSTNNALYYRSWIPLSGEIKGILIIIHGLNEHSGRYIQFAMQLMANNFGVYGMDWTGHGGSDGLHGYVPSLDHVVVDTGIFLEKVKSENPGMPCFLFGHSTGGAVVLKAALYPHINSSIEGVILTSPALRVKPAHPVVGVMAPIFSLFVPKFQFKGANKRGIPVSRDPEAMVAKYSDPLVYTGPIRVRTGHEILRISAYLMQNITSVTVPFFVLHGTADKVTDPSASQDLYKKAASNFKDIKLYEGFLHDLLFEPEREEIAGDIINWMEKRLQHRKW